MKTKDLIDRRRLLNSFIELVKIDSLSKDERKAADWTIKKLRRMGYQVKEDQAAKAIDGNCGNLFVYIKGTSPLTVLLNAHLDTVEPGLKIQPKVVGQAVKSSGKTILGADNKAGVAALLEIMETIKDKQLAAKASFPNLLVIFTVAEEIGLSGAKVIRPKVKADFGYTLDGGDLQDVVTSAPTQINFEVIVRGKAAHAGIHPEEGISAIRAAGEAVARVKLGRLDHETTANIGIIRGGVATNIIPDEVYLKGEARSHNPAKLHKVIENIRRQIKTTIQKHRCRFEMRLIPLYRSFHVSSQALPVRKLVTGLKRCGVRPRIKSTGGGSDANIFNAMGVPTIIVGVGADRVHTTNERLKLKDFYAGTQAMLDTLLSFGEKT